jgi:hypothetical protein
MALRVLNDTVSLVAVVNHRRSHSVIELFHHTAGSSSMRYHRTISSPLITTPNDVEVVGDDGEMVVTLDHRFGPKRFWRVFEDYFQLPLSSVLHISGMIHYSFRDCR